MELQSLVFVPSALQLQMLLQAPPYMVWALAQNRLQWQQAEGWMG